MSINELEKLLKRYDNKLLTKGRMNGEKFLTRQSPFNKLRQHDIFSIRNQFIGSGKWILRKLMLMDSQKYDFVNFTLKHNEKIRKSADKYDREIHRDVVKFIKENEKIVI